MMLLSEEEVKAYDFSSHAVVIPEYLKDSLIGEPILGTSYFKTLGGDPTKSGYIQLANGNRVYKTEHQPTGSQIRYRKINSLMFGEVWEVVPNGG